MSRIGAQRFRVTVTGDGTPHVVNATVHRLGTHRTRLVVSGPHLPRADGHARTRALRRGRRGRAPGQPRRGRRAALARARRWSSRRRRAVGAEVAAGRAGARARVDEDGDPAQRAVRGHGARAARVDRQPGRDRCAADPARADRRAPSRPRPSTEVDLELPDADRRRRATRSPTSTRCCSASTSIPATTARTLQRYLTHRDAAAERGEDVLSGEIGLLSVFADFAELSRNRPADEEARTELRVHSPREYFHSYLQSLDVERSGLPELFSTKLQERARALRRHRSRTHAGARRRGVPHLPGPAALGARPRDRHRDPAALAHRARAGRRPRGAGARAARPAGAGHPAALRRGRRPRPQRAVPLVRPAGRRPRARRGAGRRAGRGRVPRRQPGRRRPRRADGRAGRDPRAHRQLPQRAAAGRRARRASRCSRC